MAFQNVMAGVLADHLVMSCNVHALSPCCTLLLPSLLAMQNRRQLTEIANAHAICAKRLIEDLNPPVCHCIRSSSIQRVFAVLSYFMPQGCLARPFKPINTLQQALTLAFILYSCPRA